MGDWPVVRLEELAARERSAISKPYGSAIVRSDYVPQGVPVVRGTNLSEGRFRDEGFVFISEALADRMPGARLQPGDLVLTHRGSVGQVSMLPRRPKYQRYALSTSQVKARLDPARALPEFYYYWFQSPVGRASILQGVSTVGVPGLARPVESVKALPVPLPPLEEQRRIAEALSAFDDLIDADLEQVQNLQRLALAHYGELASECVDIVTLGDVAKVNPAQTTPKSAGGITYLDISAVGDRTVTWPEQIAWSEAPSRARRLAAPGSVIWSTVRPNRRAHALLTHVPDDLVVSTGLAVLAPDVIGPAEVFCATDSDSFVAYLMSRAEGSAYPAVRGQVFETAPIAFLGPDVSRRFEESAWPLLHAAGELQEEAQQLRDARDVLLGELFTRRVSVREVAV